MNSRVKAIVESCKTPEQIQACLEWVGSLQTISAQQKDELITELESKLGQVDHSLVI